MVQIYIKHTDGNYYLADLDPAEAINLKTTVRDLNDISKIFSPFTQSFNLKATKKNKILCGFYGNEKILRVNNSGIFDSLIYVAGFLFNSGILSLDETEYELRDQKNIKTNFESTLTSLTEILGETTIQDLFINPLGVYDDTVKIEWNPDVLKSLLTSVKVETMGNGIELKYGIPFISNNRVWTYDTNLLSTVDNIAFKASKFPADVNFINSQEVRPAISYMTIMRHLLLRIGVPVICPIFDRPEVKDLFAWGNAAETFDSREQAILLANYDPLTLTIDDVADAQIPNVFLPPASNPRWLTTGGPGSGIFKVKRENVITHPANWGSGFDVNLNFNNLESLGPPGTKIKVVLRNTGTGIILDSKEIISSDYSFRILDPVTGASMLDANDEIFFSIEILPLTLMKWDSISFSTVQKFRYEQISLNETKVTKATYIAFTQETSFSINMGGSKINLIATLPKMKCVDFLKSFLKTFNILVVSTGDQFKTMHWLTSTDVDEINKPYSKRLVDYTQYADTSGLLKGRANQYNQYSFSHFASKYFESFFGNGDLFGSLIYPELPPVKPTKFEVKTDYSILKSATTFKHPSGVTTCLGFTKEAPTVLPNGGNRYKPVFGEFTLFYLQPKSLELSELSVELTISTNAKLSGILEASFKNSFTGKTLAFGAVNLDSDSLYLNYYKKFIELLIAPNTYKTVFTLTLPAHEIYLNFANLAQGESNIPTGFRAQNEIIIGEQRYQLVDSTIDLTTGKTKLTVLNF